MSASTEVQRTLVKSPPELWAELSDPAALARHLGELGDIRITRTEPERAVDWEATAPDGAKASGRVEISPTGWGTRVTFSAMRPAGAPSAPAHSEAGPQANSEAATPHTHPGEAAAPSPGALTATDSFAATDSLAATDDPGDTDSQVFAAPLAATDPFPDEGLPGEDDPIDDPLDEDDPLEDPLSDDDPYLDDDPYADDDLDDDDGVLVRGDIAIARQRDNAPAAEPRRGFFARLFGLARRTIPEPRAHRETIEPPAYEPYDDIKGQLPPPELPSSMAMAEQVTLSYEDVGATPPAGDLRVEPLSSELAALDAATLSRAHAAEHTDGIEVGEIAATADLAAAPAEPAGAEVASAQAGALDAAPVAPAPAPAQGGTPSDIAGELRTAEEITAEQVEAEQVKAVLTSALDRLGAAHHRPFSRG